MNRKVAKRRLQQQRIVQRPCASPAALVAYLGAVQAQDYGAAKWALGLRIADGGPDATTKAMTDATIESAVADGSVLRIHAMRGTWQFIAPADVRWMLALAAPRLASSMAARHRQLGIDATTIRRSRAAIEKALRDGASLTRGELAAALTRARVSPDGQRLAHLLLQAELDAVICSGGRRGKQSTYMLLDLRAPATATPLARDEALAALAARYFRSRGPATLDDFVWWSGLTVGDARAALASIRTALVSEVIDGETGWSAETPAATPPARAPIAHLLPAFDEYLVGYRVRDAVLDPAYTRRFNAGGGLLAPCVVVNGFVIGTWRRTIARRGVTVELDLFAKATARARTAIDAAAARYGAFLGADVTVVA